MAAVNEIMGKNYIPLDFQDYLVRYSHPPFLYHRTNSPTFCIIEEIGRYFIAHLSSVGIRIALILNMSVLYVI